MNNRVPPNNLQAEESLLGALLLSKDACRNAIPMVNASDFYKPSHRCIFIAVQQLFEQGNSIDPVTVAEMLKQEGTLERSGGQGYLVGLQAATPATASAARYAQIIVNDSLLRQIISVCADITNEAYAAKDVHAVIEQFQLEAASIEMPLAGKLPEGLWTVEDFMARSKGERPQWLIRGLLREGWRVMVVAVEGFGKTVLLHQIALCAARGVHPFLDDITIPPVTTLLVDCENPEDRLDDGFEYIMPRLDKVAPAIPNRAYLWTQPGGINVLNRGDLSKLEAVIAHVQPKIVCAGPLYKMFEPDGSDHATIARKHQARWDDLRTRYKFALVLENHATKGSNGIRSMDPEGSALWLRWSEFGLKMLPNAKLNTPNTDPIYYDVERFRRDRIRKHGWPSILERAEHGMPWGAQWKDSKWEEYMRDDLAEVMPDPPPPSKADSFEDDESDPF